MISKIVSFISFQLISVQYVDTLLWIICKKGLPMNILPFENKMEFVNRGVVSVIVY